MALLFSSIIIKTDETEMRFCAEGIISGETKLRAEQAAKPFLEEHAGKTVTVDVKVYQANCDEEKMKSMIRHNPEILKNHSLPYGFGSFSFVV